MAYHRFLCKNCRKEVFVPASAIGQRASCMFCGTAQIVPTAKEDAAFRLGLERAVAALAEIRRRQAEREQALKESEKRRLEEEKAKEREEERRRQEEQKRRNEEEKQRRLTEEANRRAAALEERRRQAEAYTRWAAGVDLLLPVRAQQPDTRLGGEVGESTRKELERFWYEAEARAQKIVDERTEREVTYRIAQVLEDRELCYKGNFVPGEGWLCDGPQFSLVGVDTKSDADEEVYTQDLYFAGTYTFTTVEGLPRTVTEYACDREYAVGTVIRKFDLLPATFWAGGQADTGPRTPTGEMGPAVLRCSGTGFAITEEGHIVTNYHVIRDGSSVRVRTKNELVPAEIVAYDAGNDLAMLKIKPKTDCVVFSSARTANLGQTVFTVGFPMPDLEGFSPKVTKGVISSLKGFKDDVRNYQIDAAVQPGNSGGPLADERGNVVGVVVASLNDRAVMAEQGIVPQNVNYAVKLAYLLAMIDANPEAAKCTRTSRDSAPTSFEDAVAKVAKATVMIAVY